MVIRISLFANGGFEKPFILILFIKTKKEKYSNSDKC